MTSPMYQARVLGLLLICLVASSESIATSDQVTQGGIRYELVGEGQPILLIHGAYMEDALVPIMRSPALSGFRKIHYHRRGYGGSVSHNAGLSIEQEAADAIALLDELSIRKAHVVGYSSGGVIAYKLAVSYPDRVGAVSLIEPALQVQGAGSQGSPPFLQEAFSSYEAGDVEGAVDTFWSVVGNPGWKASIQEALSDGVDQVNRNAHIFFELEAPAVLAFAIAESEARSIRNPVQYLVSDAGAPGSVELRAQVQQWIPQTQEVLIENADHALPLQQAESIGRAIADFFEANPAD